MDSTNRCAALLAALLGTLMMLALAACGTPDQPTGASQPTSQATTTTTAQPTISDTAEATAVATTTATATAAPQVTSEPAGGTAVPTDTIATPTLTPVDNTDPFTGTDELPDTDQITSTGDISGTGDVVSTHPVAEAIATYFEVPVEDVIALHQDGLGFGEIARAYFLALELSADGDASNDLTAQQILALHQGGLGWGQIVAQLGLPHSNSQRNLGMIMSGRKLRDGDANAVTNASGSDDDQHGPPAVPPGQQKEKQKEKGNDKPHGNGNAGNNGNGNGNGGGHGNGGGGGKKK
jgi:hypothetical protein